MGSPSQSPKALTSPWICLLGRISQEAVGRHWMQKLMSGEAPEWMETVELRLLRRVAQAVEAGEAPASLLTELQAELEAAKQRPRLKRLAGTSSPNPKLLTAKAPRTPRPEGLIGEDKRNF